MGNISDNVVLVVEDDPDSRALVCAWLTREGYEVVDCENAEDAIAGLATALPMAVCLDLELPGMGGIDALRGIKSRHPKLPVLILTANREVDTVVSAMQNGAYDYLPKPIDKTKLVTAMRNAVERYQMEMRLTQLEREAGGTGYANIVGQSRAMKALFRQLDRVASSDITALIHGESGTGKELVAYAIHANSARKNADFVALNCAAIPESLQESEFFGHEKGSFTGATAMRKGKFEQAHGGTLFLDEVAELSMPLQAKLLRVLQERKFQRVGGNQDIASDFRLVAASHRDLQDLVQAGKFREDLYFRIAVFDLELPPLREREDDVLLLAQQFLDEMGGGEHYVLSPDAADVLRSHSWPGNVRELRNVIQRATVVCQDTEVRAADLPRKILGNDNSPLPVATGLAGAERANAASMEDIERKALEEALDRAKGNVTEVVRQLGIGRTTVYRKMKKYGLR